MQIKTEKITKKITEKKTKKNRFKLNKHGWRNVFWITTNLEVSSATFYGEIAGEKMTVYLGFGRSLPLNLPVSEVFGKEKEAVRHLISKLEERINFLKTLI